MKIASPVNRRLQKRGNAGQEARGLNFTPLGTACWVYALR